MAVSSAAARDGLVYWESGSVADRLTGRGLPNVFRVGASGANLGTNSATFAAQELAPRLHRTVGQLRVAIVNADDDYARSVGDAAARTAEAAGMPVVTRLTYDLSLPRWGPVMRVLKTAHPDVIILASHIPDGIAFRRAMLRAHLTTGALIGSTMAECVPDFAVPLGTAAIGIFGSDRPAGGFDPASLSPAAQALYEAFSAAWVQSGSAVATPSPASTPAAEEYGDGGGWPSDGGDAASEEGLAGFSAGWALFHDVLPQAVRGGGLDAQHVADAARSLDLPDGSLPNGAGVRFSSNSTTLGQNERAIGMVWQWQAVDRDAVVWPATFADAPIRFVPLSP